MSIHVDDLDNALDELAGLPVGTGARMRKERANGVCSSRVAIPGVGEMYCDRPVDPRTGAHTDTIPYLFVVEHRAGDGAGEVSWDFSERPRAVCRAATANQNAFRFRDGRG